MPPKRKGRNKAPAKNPPGLQCSARGNKKSTVTTGEKTQDGPERFAPWYPLLQKVRKNNGNKQHNNLSATEEHSHQIELMEAAILGDFDLFSSDAPKVFVNRLVHPSEYPAVQLRNGVLTPQMSREPKNLAWLQARLRFVRNVSDWSPSRWETYKMRSQFGTTREATRFEMTPLFKKYPDRPAYVRTFFQRFDDFPEFAPFAQGIEKPCPGFAQGYRAQAYRAIGIDCLCAAVCFNRSHFSLTLPHIAGEFASTTLEAEQAARARHGAALVYMRNVALGHARKKDAEDMAVIITFVTNGLSIQFYAHYASTSPNGMAEYHQYPILTANLMSSYTEFLAGVTMLRNCQDHALFSATHLKDILEDYHAKNGVNAWAYHPNEGEHLLSESEDDKIEDGGIDEIAKSSGNGKNDTGRTNNEDDSSSPTSRQAQHTRVLRPRKRAAQVGDKKI
ncbi:hypothetical protein ACHAQJ_005078 [Trichoderma viride]